MANCSTCGKIVDGAASSCPSCGKPNRSGPSSREWCEEIERYESTARGKNGKYRQWSDYKIIDDQKHGKGLQAEGEYKSSQRQGKWIYWHPNGQKKEEGEYEDGKRHGKWTRWDDNDQKASETEWKDGEKHGKWTIWHDNGQKKEEGEHLKGEQSGNWIYWDEDGLKWKEEEVKGGIYVHSKATVWKTFEIAPMGNRYRCDPPILNYECEYRDGEKHGSQTFWHANGRKAADAVYENGKQVEFKYYSKHSGWYYVGWCAFWCVFLWLFWQINFAPNKVKDGEKHGNWIYVHDNGQKKAEGKYKDGKRDGSWTFWNEAGKQTQKGTYSAYRNTQGNWTSSKHGEWAIFGHPDGSASAKGRYHYNKKHYEWIEWYDNGQKKSQGPYNDDQPCCKYGSYRGWTCWDRAGKEINCRLK